ncbi:MAG: adenylyltransferase/cytidyltransferase family protein [Chitinophagales bacterium]|nr:adenylyltransferase/cytidyltransferase family protein [Chitinophagales bacterium]
MSKKVFVTGCFDLLHSGHVAFLKEAAQFGDLYVCIGNDENVKHLKGRYPVNNQEERRYMLDALACVKEVRINKGWGIIDFEQELAEIAPDVFVVNEDGHTPAKEALCRENHIEYNVLSRKPHVDLPVRSTTSLRTVCTIPFRIDIAGGWLDQPYVSKFFPGPVLTVSIEPTLEFNDRSGMASSTRRKAIELWKTEIPAGDKEQLAKILFVYDNPPGSGHVSGSQDSIGIVFPGLNKLNYHNDYWPQSIESVQDDDKLHWIESHFYLVTLGPRVSTYNVLENTVINAASAKALADAADRCWEAMLHKDLAAFGEAFKASFEAQIAMFPNMMDEDIWKVIEQYRSRALGWKLSGAGGGGYLILVSDKPIENAIQIKIRRRDVWG